MKLHFIGSNGSENPTKSVLPFLGALGAVDEGFEAEITLVGDAVVLVRQSVTDAVVPVGWPPLSELMAQTIEHGIPLFI